MFYHWWLHFSFFFTCDFFFLIRFVAIAFHRHYATNDFCRSAIVEEKNVFHKG